MAPKFKIVLILLIIGSIGCDKNEEFTVDCLAPNLQNGVIAFYPFNNGSLDDASSNSNNITNPTTAKAASDRNGNPNCAFLFDNTQMNSEFLTTTNSSFLNNLDAFSVSLWYEPMDTTNNGATYEVLLGRSDSIRCPNRRGEWSVGLYDCRRAVFGHNNSVWANAVTDLSNGCEGEVIALTDTWHHVVATKKGNNFKLYFNGNLDESKSGIANCTNMQLAADIGDLFIGNYYSGKIDDILIYERELSYSEVLELYDLGSCCE